MVQTNFSVGNAGSLTTVLADISGGADSAINTAYTITMTGGLGASSESVSVPSGSSVTLVGSGPFIVPDFSASGSVIADLNFTGTLTLDGGWFENLPVTLNNGLIANGLFSGAVLGTLDDGGDTVINGGSILYTGPFAAVELDSGLVQNGWNGAASALISGSAGGVALLTGGLLQNGGTVVASGTASAGVFLGAGTVFNGQIGATAALISGGQNGLEIQDTGLLNNAGTIIGVTSDGAYLGSGTVINGQLGDTAALISGGTGDNGLWIGAGAGTVTNFGTITGGGLAGAYLGLGGTVTNGGPADTVATIAGAEEGVVFGAAGALTNYGTVLANGSNASQQVIGAFLGSGGAVANLGSAADIAGIDAGVVIEGSAGTLTNQGTISASGASGVGGELTAGGTIVNAASAVLSGGFDGVLAVGGASTVINSGSIMGGAGVDFSSNVTTGAGTVINSGLIESTAGANGYAVIFGAGVERLVMQQGGTLIGQVLGNNASGSSTVLEFGSGTSGTLAALGSDSGTVIASTGAFGFRAVGTIAIDSGASWNAAASDSFDTLSNAGALGITGGAVTVTGSLTNSGGLSVTAGTLSVSTGTVLDSGVITVVGASSAVTVAGGLTVGDQGIGELSILSGATLSAMDGNIGVGANASGTVDIEGAGSRLNLSGSLTVGGLGAAELTLGQNTTLMVVGNLLTGAGGTFNQSGLVDPTNIINDGVTNLNAGAVDLADVSVQNSAQYSVSNGAATIYTKLITFDANPDTDNGSTNGVWTIKSQGTLILNSATVDNSQVFQFSTTNGVLVIGQQPSIDISNHVTGTLAQGAANVLPNFSAPIQNYKAGDQIQLQGLTYRSATASGNVVTVWSGTNGTGSELGTLSFLTLAGGNDSSGATAAATQLTAATLCFLPGTLIATPDGEVPVQSLKVGDTVRTASGRLRPVTWIGTGQVLAVRGRRTAATPVIVKRHALGPNVPHKDLRVTKGHAFMFGSVLIPVEFLVNHRSIMWDDRAQEVTLYHVELDAHDVLIANGAPAESYRDDGNRWLFRNANTGWDQPPKKPCAPVLTGGPVVDAVWRRLLDQAGARPGLPLTDDPDLHLMVDGRRIDGKRFGQARVFTLPETRSSVRIMSRSGVPAELGLARDPRELGVAVKQIVVRQGQRFHAASADDPALSDGFHAYEPELGLRWTTGNAVLPADLFEGFDGRVDVVIHVSGSTSYVLRDVSRVA